MNRRTFITNTALSSLALCLPSFRAKGKTHILTFSFDDGFKKSFFKVADIHENYGLKACFNTIATGHFKNFTVKDDWILPEILGNFNDWNALKERGHEVMPHTWQHLNLTKIPLSQAKKNIDKCLDYFEANLHDYKAEEAIYNFAYNASNLELENHCLERVRAVRTGGRMTLNQSGVNPLPEKKEGLTLGCWAKGPDLGDEFVEKEVSRFLDSSGGWLVINLHGLDKEGWGPLSTTYFDQLLKRLVDINN